MRTYIALGVLLAVAFFFVGCKSNKQTANPVPKEENNADEINYIVAKNYFVNNDVLDKQEQKDFIISNQKDFEKYFSPAAFMGKDGEPTQIDFDKQFCLCVILPESDILSRLSPLSITKTQDKSLKFDYSLILGKRVSYFTRNCLIVVIDKEFLCDKIVFNKVFNR